MNTYNFHINIFDLAFLCIIFGGIGAAALLWFARKQQQYANRFLSLAITVIILTAFQLFANDIHINSQLMPIILSFGALVFLYVGKYTHPQHKLEYRELLHFIPLLIALVLKWNNFEKVIFTMITPIMALIYLIASLKQVQTYYQLIKFNNGERSRDELNWLKWFLIIIWF